MAAHDDHWILFRLQRLDPRRFEELCFALLAAEGHEDVRHLGASGRDRGVDLLSIGPDSKRWVTQCKRYRSISPSDVRPEVRKVIKKPPNPPPGVYRLAATCDVSTDTETALQEEVLKALVGDGDRRSFSLELASTWAATELVAMLRDKYPELRERFISPQMDEAAPPRWSVPYPRNPFFEGREEVLEELRRRLVEGSAGALCQGIGGLGGIGKTQTALEYAWRHRKEYEAVLWVRAETVAELRAGLVEVTRELKLPGVPAEVEEDEVLAAVMRWLETTQGWLLVYDNADEPEILLPYLPRGGGGHVLVTSRANAGHLARTLRLSAPVALEVLESSEALRFLLERTLRKEASRAEEEEAGHLAADLGYLPLALEQAAAYMLETAVGFADYRASFEARRPEHLWQFQPADYHATVATTWAVNVDQVCADHPEVMGLLKACAFFSPADIPVELLLAAGWKAPDEKSGAAEVVNDRSRLSELLGPLVRFSLLTRDMERLTVGVHRLVQTVIVDGMDEGRRREWVKRCVEAASRLFPRPELNTWPQCRRLHLHALKVLQHADSESLEAASVAFLLGSLANFADDRGAYEEAEALNQRSLAITEKALGSEHPEVAATLMNLGLLYVRQGRYAEAESLFKRSLAITEKALGSEHPKVAATLMNLGSL